MLALVLGVAVLAIWLGMAFGRAGFWRADLSADADAIVPPPAGWPEIVAVIPARDEADVIGTALASHAAQDYAGSFRMVLVDDGSSDGTAEVARAAGGDRLTVLRGAPLPAGWTGKLWAMHQGVAHVEALPQPPRYILLADADIAFAPGAVTRLVARAEAGGLALTSWMVKLSCATFAERALIPAFVWFFQLLYPFARVNDPASQVAAAAGGCMLVRRDALAAAGGVAAIRAALIDDCALGALLKRHGPVRLGLTRHARSLRPYRTVGEVGRMVSRSAYHQLRYSPALLAGTVAGLLLTYIAPPALALLASGVPQLLGAAAWGLMALLFLPMLRFYGRSPLWAPALPLIAAAYAGFTVQSALQHARGRGGLWKGRVQAARAT